MVLTSTIGNLVGRSKEFQDSDKKDATCRCICWQCNCVFDCLHKSLGAQFLKLKSPANSCFKNSFQLNMRGLFGYIACCFWCVWRAHSLAVEHVLCIQKVPNSILGELLPINIDSIELEYDGELSADPVVTCLTSDLWCRAQESSTKTGEEP